MARIQFSAEVYEKLKSSNCDDKACILLEKFSPYRSAIKKNEALQQSIASQQPQTNRQTNKSNAKAKTKSNRRKPFNKAYIGPGIKLPRVLVTQTNNCLYFAHKGVSKKTKKERKKTLRKIRAAEKSAERSKKILAINAANDRKRIRAQRAASQTISYQPRHCISGIPQTSSRSRKRDSQDLKDFQNLKKELEILVAQRRNDPNSFDRQAMK